MKKIKTVIAVALFLSVLQAQNKQNTTYQITVMKGYLSFSEVQIWVQSNIPVKQIELICYETNKKNPTVASVFFENKELNIFKFKSPIQTGKKYSFEIIINKKIRFNDSMYVFSAPALWKWRTAPPNYSFCFGSCNYINDEWADRPGKKYGDSSTNIYDCIVKEKPSFFIWLGDNTYLREPDWGSSSGINYRYHRDRNFLSSRRLLLSCPNYAIWDDHDFGPNDANGSWAYKNLTLQSFNNYWCNPEIAKNFEGNTSWFEFADAQFFLLDNRYNRFIHPQDSAENTILGKEQLRWFKLGLLSAPKDQFKIVCIGGQFLNTAALFENYSVFAKERNEIIEWIKTNHIKNVIFLTGDRHFSELSVLKLSEKNKIVDFTSSPLSSGNHSPAKNEKNLYRIDSTMFDTGRNYGKVSFVGEAKNRKAVFELKDKNGKLIWRKEFDKD